jgi:crotonobetainyl-CoA:carnitine CoA-transferase CaiB-like acyl-CoA transferase
MLGGLRVVEIGDGMAVQVAGLMLAQMGADVLKVEPLDGDPSRGRASFANWNRGKRSLACDVAASPDMIWERLRSADVLLHQFSPAKAAALGLDDAALRVLNPALVVCGITGSARHHPDVERSDDELLVAARLGVLYENDGHRAGPIVYRYRMGHWGAAYMAASAILTRLIDRQKSGMGGGAHTSIMQGFLSQLPLIWGRNSEGPMPNPPTYPLEARPISVQLFECAGGDWLQIMDPTRQFDYATMPTMWDVMAEGADIETPEGLAHAFRQRPLEAWLADLRAADVAAEPAYPLGEVLRHPEVEANHYVVAVDDPDLGPTRQPNVPFHINGAPLPTKAAPRLGEGGDEPWAMERESAPKAPSSTTKKGLLSGLKVLDLGMFLAGPMAPSMMGDMGADVIKVEALTGDRLRFMHRYFQAAARSKRSLALDLTKPEAREILERLMRWADYVHHNMRMRGAEKLGLSVDNMRRMNPDAVTSYVSAYGQMGERGNWPGYDSIFTAIAGWEFENAGEGNPPIFNRPGIMDVCSAQSCLVESLAALYAKGEGQAPAHVESSLLGVAAFSQGDVLIDASGQITPTEKLDSAQTGFSPYYRIYQAKAGQWIALAAHSDTAQAALRTLLQTDDPQAFEAAIAAWDAEQLLSALDAAHVPADLVRFDDAMNRFFDDPMNRKLGLISVMPHPQYGQIEQPGAYWDFGDRPIDFIRPCPTIGEHSDEILQTLGYSPSEIAEFRAKKIVG